MSAAKKLDTGGRVPRHVLTFVEQELEDYLTHRATVDGYEQERRDILHRYRQLQQREGGRPEGEHSDITADNVLRLEELDMRAARSRRKVKAVESIMAILTEEQRELVRLRYRVVTPACVAAGKRPLPMQYTNEQVIAEVNMGRDRFYAIRNEAIRQFAIRMGIW